jgi:BASS family bile acid:Na+ symporter
MTGVSSILAIIMVPALMSAMVALELSTQVFAVPLPQLMRQLLVTLILPILLGMWVRSRFIKFAIGNEKLFRISSITAVVGLAIFILLAGPAATIQEWVQITFFSILLCLFAMGSGFLVGGLAGLNRSDRLTLMIEYAVQNVGIAIVIAVTLMERLQFATMAAIYFLVQLPVIVVAIMLYRKSISSGPSEVLSSWQNGPHS